MAQQKVVSETEKKLQVFREQRKSLNRVYEGLETTTKQLFDKEKGATARTAQQSKLDAGIEAFGSFRTTIADLAVGLTDDLQAYVNVAAQSQNYQGLEKVLAWLPIKATHRMADNRRVGRLRTQSPAENLRVVIEYSMQLVNEIHNVRDDALKQYNELSVTTDLIVTKIAEYQPQEEQLKAKLDAMESEYKAKQETYKTATPQEQARLSSEMNDQHKLLSEVRGEYDIVLTAYKQAQEALQANIEARDTFEQMVRDLGRQAAMVKEKMENVTTIYESAPEAIKAMMTTKGMESLDKSINAATDHSVQMIIQAGGAINDATLRREEIELISADKMRIYMDQRAAQEADFQARFAAIRDRALQSQAERYAQ